MSQTSRATESELAQAIINHHRNRDVAKIQAELEAPYDHYGNRGVVDLVIGEGTYQLKVYELKSEHAVKQATGANEIIRQFKRHREYFFDGSDYNTYGFSQVRFMLVFDATEYNINHIKDNYELYATIQNCATELDRGTRVLVKHKDVRAVWPIVRDYDRDVTTHGKEDITELIGYEC